ncbi:hypothetical protein Tco_0508841, partial [Tanacetum coccineum]
VLQTHTEELKKEFSEKRDYKDVIKESMQANVINEVKNHLPKFLPKAVTDFATLIIQSTVKETLEKTPLFLAQTSSQAQSPYKAVESLSEFELKKILMDKIKQNIIKSYGAPTLMKRDWEDDDENEDPSARPNQGKNTKRRRTKESEPSNKSSTSKDSSKEQPNVEATPKTDMSRWFEQPARPPTLDPEWNKGKSVDNAPAQNWLNDPATAAKPPLTFDDLMSTPIDFYAFAITVSRSTN